MIRLQREYRTYNRIMTDISKKYDFCHRNVMEFENQKHIVFKRIIMKPEDIATRSNLGILQFE
jgi:hypothetical protein